MKILVTADIHGNFEALSAVLAAAQGQIDGFIALGDIVGYGPDPEACIQCLKKLKKELPVCVFLAGNHDAGLIKKLPLQWFGANARRSLKKTAKLVSWKTRFFLGSLRPVHSLSKHTLLVHGSPLEPLTEYLWGRDETFVALQYLRAENIRLCFCGHTHQAAIYYSDVDVSCGTLYPEPDQTIALTKECCIVNPGSVGFPRFFAETSQRAEALKDKTAYPAYYVVWDTKERSVTFKAAHYDVRITNEKISRIMDSTVR